LAPGIQESRSFFGQNRDFFKKLSNLGVDVIQPRIAGFLGWLWRSIYWVGVVCRIVYLDAVWWIVGLKYNYLAGCWCFYFIAYCIPS